MFAKKKHQGTKKDKKQVNCFGCGKLGHYKNECRSKNNKPHEENMELHVAFHSNTKRSNGDRAMWVIDSECQQTIDTYRLQRKVPS
ncbi:FOG: Transposon-encoded proteins with TYA, reverse transcriptase, integrase domains in various combinations [Plasmopara halstedii]|uniref:FOG: Transposon-encoded proteins with TYA, reverse transcriptase, integrase domains in various combinations n=1 Tax=Plasmopara halstedii TaxID=4781 RepID=A0A0N7L5D1_PLAHL|nr:FOG: Transposon-encoded proteins with TYA, reverse transcriptase, integrase domains in various combinations [Plasmopara halstedii]CEG41139.1 FOG: Transposon-encoded proteins with TYA, reverse transcriptase, integrase domains in various combinations [Plasmopara halstedii]|eukprot:XP_024577508.1 FOG: Transposon-encoded proteins with TYA, reverse transcriptase, integrase domains in various combinations [Plasmopara halstedii]